MSCSLKACSFGKTKVRKSRKSRKVSKGRKSRKNLKKKFGFKVLDNADIIKPYFGDYI